MRIVLLRHGQTSSNVTHALDTLVPGPGLTDLGERQAAAVPAALAGAGVDAVWASTAVRAQQTARPLADSLGLEVGVLDGLREIEAGELEMRTDAEAIRRYVENTVAWASGDLSARIPGAQDGAEVLARYDAAVGRVRDEGAGSGAASAVVVSHGAVIRLWTAVRVGGVDAASMAQRWLENTGAVTIESVDRRGGGDHGSDDGDRSWRLVEWHGEPLGGADLAPDRDQEGPLAPPPARVTAAGWTVEEGSAPQQ